MSKVDPDPDDAFDEPTAVSKVNAGPRESDTAGTGHLDSAASLGGNSALSDDQIFESMPSVDESISRSPKKPKDDWASSSEFDAFGEMASKHDEALADDSADDADDQDFDAPTGVHTRTPTPPPDPGAEERLPAAGFQVYATPHDLPPEPIAFESSRREELYATDSPFEAPYDDEFAIEVEVPDAQPMEAEAAEACPPEASEDEAWGAILEQAWAPCEPQRDLPTKLQRVAFAEAAVKIQTIVSPNREQQKTKNDLLAKLNAQVSAQEGLVSYTPDWRACDKSLGTLLPQLEKLTEASDKKILPSKFRGAYLAHSFHLNTCLNYFEQGVRSGDHGITWWERITSLSVASATKMLANGDRELLPVTEVVALWNGRLPAQQVQRSTIVAAARFFQESIAKLATLSGPDDYFKSGLALEVIGYQISLREDIFRPEILYAATDFHTQLHNWLNSDAIRPLRSKLDGEFTSAYEKAGSIFGL